MTQLFEVASIVVQVAVVMGLVLFHVAYITYAERKILGFIQDRMGPMEVGPHGILQPIADGIKFLFKEDIIPAGADKFLFTIAPIMVFVPIMVGFAVVPFSDGVQIADINIGILFIFAISSMAAYGVLLGGWASNSKYSLLGGLRAAAQVVSYELVLGLSVVGVLLLAGSLRLSQIVEAQADWWFIWFQPVAFLLFLIAALAETNRIPFDLPEAESELVAGYFTEYSGMRFALFFMAEYAGMILMSSLATILFLGGWLPPLAILGFLPPLFWFLVKVYGLLFFFIWLRGTVPRLRYDQLMKFGWKVLLPVAFANILVTALVVYVVEVL